MGQQMWHKAFTAVSKSGPFCEVSLPSMMANLSTFTGNPFKRNSFHSGATALQMRPSALAMLDIFLDYLYASALWDSQHIQQLMLKHKEEGGGGAGSNGNNGLVEVDEGERLAPFLLFLPFHCTHEWPPNLIRLLVWYWS
jgi:hypothetical protein